MPTKPHPETFALEELERSAEHLQRDLRERRLSAAQRVREFHPRFRDASDAAIFEGSLGSADARLTVAREYGFGSWDRLKAHAESPDAALRRPHHERITDATFRRAVDLIDAGDAERLRAFLTVHPGIVRQRVRFEGGNYFGHPSLLEFIAENPSRHGRLPERVADVARVLLEAGAGSDPAALNEALALVASSDVARRSGRQEELVELLVAHGADPNAGMHVALLYGEFDAATMLLRHGAAEDIAVAAAFGNTARVEELLGGANERLRQLALNLAAQHGRLEVVRLLLDAGEDPNRYAPVGGHSHATPLHQAALAGHEDVVRLLVERGARTDIPDIHYDAPALGWAEHDGRTAVADYLRSR